MVACFREHQPRWEISGAALPAAHVLRFGLALRSLHAFTFVLRIAWLRELIVNRVHLPMPDAVFGDSVWSVSRIWPRGDPL